MCIREEWESNGDKKLRKTFVPLVAWDSKAEEFAEQIKTGDVVEIKGNYKTRSYEKAGVKQYRHDFNIWSLEVVGHENVQARTSGSAYNTGGSTPAPAAPAAPSAPAQETPTAAAPAAGGDEVPDLSLIHI